MHFSVSLSISRLAATLLITSALTSPLSLVLAKAPGGDPYTGPSLPDLPMRPHSDIKESLKETLEKTYMNNAELDAARAGLRAQDENVAIAVSEWRPSLSLSGNHQNNLHYSQINSAADAHGNSQSYKLTASQNVFAGGGTLARTDGARQGVFGAREGLLNTEQTVLFGGVQAHTGVIAQEAILDLRRNQEAFLKKVLEQTQVRYEIGEVTRTDVEAAKGQYQGAQSDRVQAEGDLESAYATYLKQVGSPALSLEEPTAIGDLPATLDESIEISVSSNPSIRQAEFSIRAAEADVRAKEAALLPSVDIQLDTSGARNGGTGFSEHENPINPKKRTTDVTFSTGVTVPLYAKGGADRASIRQAYQSLAQAKVSKVAQERAVREQTTQAWESLRAAMESVVALKAQVAAQEIAVEGINEEARVGQRTILDVLQVEQNLIDAQVKLVGAKKTLVEASYRLLAAMGTLRAKNLALDVEYYDPEAYYDDYSTAAFQFWEGDDLRYVKEDNEDK